MEQSVTLTSKPKVSKLAILSFILSFIPLVGLIGVIIAIISESRINKSRGTLGGQGFVIAAFIIGLVNFFLPLSIPSMIRYPNIAKMADAKSGARTIQLAVEDYKASHHGRRPANIRDIENLLPEHFKKQKNPFDFNQSYTVSGGGLVDGEPTRWGEIGYIAPKDSTKPYQIITFRTGDTLRLTEELATVKVDSSGMKSP